MPSFRSAGTLPVYHMVLITLCKASLTGFLVSYRCCAVMLSVPAARLLFNRRIVLVISCNIGTYSESVTCDWQNLRNHTYQLKE